ncbi:glycosyl transferase [Bradyrhizobium sp. INPA01-394B]|uniref:Glycosyltransferase family 39 protein n=1 Tax=Bradyrhizobium campsiandrae TaxID=1729892 RepID=A0ABR7UG10_9BRAD|nr:glycosyltransferase family 39 protein [Bradyrhizobium campsiandrae]MBC9881555.1 glycosyl transferase [Bradyrhizobium campsiandrae]MBC9982531.1 glycosyltransferase family 39 protein [Bradyrhizobium campsiandrae]
MSPPTPSPQRAFHEHSTHPPSYPATTSNWTARRQNPSWLPRASWTLARRHLGFKEARRGESVGSGDFVPHAAAARLSGHLFAPGKRLLCQFSRLDKSRYPVLWVIGLFVIQAIPAAIVRASNLEEGRIIAIARGAMEDGHWLTPFVYGARFAERPVLLSWISALLGEMTGGVTLWSLRIPHLGFFLAGALLIYSLLRSSTGKSAAIFGALCWISMPMVAAKFINAEPDIVLSTLLFAAFHAWWTGTITKRMTLSRWSGITILIILAGLTKGPQPVAYFTLGVGAYLLLKRREQIPEFIVASILAMLVVCGWYVLVYQPQDIDYWADHSRLLTMRGLALVRDHIDFVKSILVETLPATILIGPAVVIVLRRWRTSGNDLMFAAVLYSLTCTLVLVLWPGGVAARYAMPATMTLAVVCGLMFEHCRQRSPRVIVSALFVSCLIFGGLLLRAWVAMPFWPHLFQESRIAGKAIAAALQDRPGPLHVVTNSTEYNMLVYVRGPIRSVTLDHLARLKTSGVAVMLPVEQAALAQQDPSMRLVDLGSIVSMRTPYRIVEIQPSEPR